MTTRKELARQALERSLEVRDENGYDFRSPICVYELCARAGVKVQFVDNISMEGVYAAFSQPTILLSALRPLSRRAFTCAHELGHHAFEHGSTIDELKDGSESTKFKPEEFLADAFAGFVLMPAQAVKRAFSVRDLDFATATPQQIYTVSCSFGVGYETLIGHLQYSMQAIGQSRSDALRRVKLPKIREQLLGRPAREPLVIADSEHALGTLDAEVGMLILLPSGAFTESENIEFVRETPGGDLYRALRPGLARITVPTIDWGVVVRVARFQYSGLARYRHLEETDGE